MTKVDATAVVAAFNCSVTIAACVNSVLSQNGVNVEVIIVDDCSNDDTLETAHALAHGDPRVRVIGLTRNGGPSVARNAALKTARGRFIAIIDSDDTIEAGRLARMISFADEKSADIVFDNFIEVDENGTSLSASPYLVGPAFDSPVAWSLEDFLAGNLMGGGTNLGYLKPVIRRSFLEANEISYDESLRNSEDMHLVADCLIRGAKLWFIPQAGYRYTVRAGSISHRVAPELFDALVRADDVFIDRHRHALSARGLELMRQRRDILLDTATVESMMQSLKAGRVGDSLRALGERPRASARLFRQLGEAALKRIVPGR